MVKAVSILSVISSKKGNYFLDIATFGGSLFLEVATFGIWKHLCEILPTTFFEVSLHSGGCYFQNFTDICDASHKSAEL